jgi:tRNA(Arg) A34 adenosine deaminase TadA
MLCFMQTAVNIAEHAQSVGCIPVGAVITLNNKIIAASHNGFEGAPLPSSMRHAEIGAMLMACNALGQERLDGSELYVTLEPCDMCMGAIRLMKIKKVVFGAYRCDGRLVDNSFELIGGISESACSEQLRRFFQNKRDEAVGLHKVSSF